MPLETFGLPHALSTVKPTVEGSPPVIVVPGIYASDKSMAAMRLYLRRAGYNSRGWGLGRNMAGAGWEGSLEDLSDGWLKDIPENGYHGEGEVPALCDRFGAQIRKVSDRLKRPVALVGWSLGGFIAREAARDNPDYVAGIVTLGAPVIGGPKYTATRKRFAKRGYDIDWVEAGIMHRYKRPLQCPVVSIYSKRDAIVGWRACIDRWTPGAKHHEVHCGHTAFGYHPPSLKLVKAELDAIFAPPP